MSTLMTPVGVLSYPKLFKPALPKNPKPEDKAAYSTTILWDAAAVESPEYKAIVAAVTAAARELFGDKFEALLKDDKLKMPFRKDIASSGYDPEKFTRFANLRNVADPARPAPSVVDRNPKVKVTDPARVYPGVLARCSVSVFAFDKNGNRGVSLSLRNVQLVADGPRLDSFTKAEDEFGELPAMDGAAGEADDLAAALG